jgi:serine/threonine protein kinase
MSTVPPSDADLPGVEGFLKTVLRSRLLNREQLQEALRDVPKEQREDPRALAEHLVRKGKLSRFQAGKLLKGTGKGLVMAHFQVLSPIGRGGMGTVYLARDERSGELVALKLLPPSRWRGEDRLLARFQREMEISRRVAHPHLAWTYEAGLWRGVYYLAMEYIPGKNLSRIVADSGPLRVPRAARLMAEVASALEHAHNQGLIHRDLKPSNILITPRDHAKVLDLGLALVHGEKAETTVVGGQGYIVGTMDYIAPEQTTDSAGVDRRSDIYSLGCTLYFALSGQPPFPGGTSREKIYRHRGEEPTPLLEVQPSVPAGFAELIHKMMAKDPAERPPSMAAVEEELRAWAAGEPALPMDQPEDPQFVEAVAAVQAAEPSAEYSLPSLSSPELTVAAPGAAREPEAAQRRLPAWATPLLVAIALVLGGLAVLVLLLVWLWPA